MNRLITCTATFLLVISLTSCESIPRKFVRKKTRDPIQPVVYTQKEFVKQFTNKYYYKMHYSYWKSWHDELLNSMGRNSKRERRSVEEALSHLEEMHQYLIEPKKSELSEQIDILRALAVELNQGTRNTRDRSLRIRLERSERIIRARFDYASNADFVLPDEIQL